MGTKIYAEAIYGFRQDTLANWESENPILEVGEPAIVSDSHNGEWLKIGDGETTWKELPWKMGPKGNEGPAGPKGDKGEKGEKGEKGDPGENYIITEADKTDIANIVLSNFTDVSEVGQ